MSRNPLHVKQPSVKDLRVKISETSKEVERVEVIVKELESLPVIHEDLQTKVRNLARILAYLEGMKCRIREKSSTGTAISVVNHDFDELKEKRGKGKVEPLT